MSNGKYDNSWNKENILHCYDNDLTPSMYISPYLIARPVYTNIY